MPDDRKAVLLRGVGGNYLLADAGGTVGIATLRGVLRRDSLVPAVGDHVSYSESGDPDVPFRIDVIHERRNFLPRPPIANLDVLFIAVSAADPLPDLLLVDKMLILCGAHDIRPVICITKSDLDPSGTEHIRRVYRNAGFDVRRSGLDDAADLDLLRNEIPGRTVGIAGQSGVGKSTILNRLTRERLMDTGELSNRIRRGRHTTRRVELFPFGGGYLADTPGFSQLDLWDVGLTGDGVISGYPEIRAITDPCRFQGCRHIAEPGCAVATNPSVDAGRLERYRRFRTALDAVNPWSRRRPPPI
ncbi:MAG: ribosome small subunit-dependent GTPase A [Clostridia bacterium]|nr:ribosome small subunit-dependent GTPase A [Clostridia bacterium]